MQVSQTHSSTHNCTSHSNALHYVVRIRCSELDESRRVDGWELHTAEYSGLGCRDMMLRMNETREVSDTHWRTLDCVVRTRC